MAKFKKGSKVRIRKGAVLVKWNAIEKRDMRFCLLDTETVHRVESTTSVSYTHLTLPTR